MAITSAQINNALSKPAIVRALKPLIRQQKTLKAFRLLINHGTKLLFFVAILVLIIEIFFLERRKDDRPPISFILYFFGIISIWLYFLTCVIAKSIQKNFLTEVVTPVMAQLYPSFTFDEAGGVSEIIFKSSGLFNSYRDYNKRMLLNGTFNHIGFDISQLYVFDRYYLVIDTKFNNSISTIFWGTFCRFDASEVTLVLLSKKKKFSPIRFIVNAFNGKSMFLTRLQTIKNPALDEDYQLLGWDAQHVNKVLSPDKIERLKTAFGKIGKPVKISLEGGVGCLAIEDCEWFTFDTCNYGQLQQHFEQYDAFLHTLFSIMAVFNLAKESLLAVE